MQFAFVILYTDCPGASTTVEKIFTLELPSFNAAYVVRNQVAGFLSEAHDGDDCFRVVEMVEVIENVSSANELMEKIEDLCS